ncbi:type IV pilus modification PilV family protein [Acetanaerobacterium elongatum]|uniref:PilX N-terminal n=1 Tax=Acetanaerobacterium elongatum TaxID=258515 RepID=A0A1G9V4H1_9FIRM|nr:hypothetical protein [Acetanaerobacterium elongatum]SDM67094.1 hypothetical protein SAMN05192585_10351 [Acetanaerobacterium elongatum]
MVVRILKNHRGSTLILVIVVFALLIIFATAALALASNSQINSVTDYQSQQAYFTARSSVLAAVDYFKNHPELNIEDYVGTPGSSEVVDGMGKYQVTVKKVDDKHFEISSLADFGGKNRTVRAIVERKSAGFPFGQNLVTATKFNAKASSLSGGAEIHGNVMINDTIALPEGVQIFGDLYIDGPVSISGGPIVKSENGKGGNIYSTGDITLNRVSVTVDGNLYCTGSLYGDGGKIDAKGSESLLMIGKNIGGVGFTIATPKNIVALGNADFRNSTIRTKSNCIYLGGTKKVYQNDNSYNYVSILTTADPSAKSFKMPDMTYADSIEQLKNLVDYAVYKSYVDSWRGNMINIDGGWKNTYTLSQSGTITNVSNFNQTLIVDTSSGNINLYVNNASLNNHVFSQFHTKVIGPNQLIIHLAEDVTNFDYSSFTSLGITGSQTEITSTTVPQVCIVAPYPKNNITLSGSAKTAAYIIMPYGNLSIGGGSIFVGNAIVGSSQLVAGAKLYYKPPKYPEIPGISKIEVSGGGSGGASGGIDLKGVYTNK